MKTLDAFPIAIHRMAAIQATLRRFGLPSEQLLVDFGPVPESALLHGVVILVNADHDDVLAVINCGPVASEPGEEQRDACDALWNGFAELWNVAPASAQDALWRRLQPVEAIVEIGAALVANGVVTQAVVEARVLEIASTPAPSGLVLP